MCGGVSEGAREGCRGRGSDLHLGSDEGLLDAVELSITQLVEQKKLSKHSGRGAGRNSPAVLSLILANMPECARDYAVNSKYPALAAPDHASGLNADRTSLGRSLIHGQLWRRARAVLGRHGITIGREGGEVSVQARALGQLSGSHGVCSRG